VTRPARQVLGQRGEAIAAAHLADLGYRIVERNWRCPQGEIDLVTHDGAEWVFVEVRTRHAPSIDPAIESVTPAKQNRLILASQAYLETHGLDDQPWRIDLVVIALTPAGRQIEVRRDAVGW